MKLNRILAVLTLLLTSIPAYAFFHKLTPAADFDLGIASFEVQQRSAILWTHVQPKHATKSVPLLLELSRDPFFSQVVRKKLLLATMQNDYTAKTKMRFLKSGQRYYYRFVNVFAYGSDMKYSEFGQFKTAPRKNQIAEVSFVISADTNAARRFETIPKTFYILDHIADANLLAKPVDFFVYFGDTVYADRVALSSGNPEAITLADYREAYRLTREDPSLQNLFKATSTYVGWDDHEVYDDYAGKTVDQARFENAAEAFFEYLPIRTNSRDHYKTYRSVRWGKDVELFFTDGRQYRDEKVACRFDSLPVMPGGHLPNEDLLNNLAPQFVPNVFFLINVVSSVLESQKLSPFPEDQLIFSELAVQQPQDPIDNAIAQLLGNPYISPVYWLFALTDDLDCVAEMNSSNRTMLGREQMQWLKDGLKSSNATWKIIVNSTPFLPNLGTNNQDNWDGYAADRQALLSFIQANISDPSKVVILTTDSHANVVKKEPTTGIIEVITGPITAGTQSEQLNTLFAPLLAPAGIDLSIEPVRKKFHGYVGAFLDKALGGNTSYQQGQWYYENVLFYEPEAYGYAYIKAYRDLANQPRLKIEVYGDRGYANGNNNPSDVIKMFEHTLE